MDIKSTKIIQTTYHKDETEICNNPCEDNAERWKDVILVANKHWNKTSSNHIEPNYFKENKDSIQGANEEIMWQKSQTQNIEMKEREALPKLQQTKQKLKTIKRYKAAIKLNLDEADPQVSTKQYMYQ